ncbi:MAG: Stp1/IreP family PP2C-type Ser/Thr phosphatase [Acidimicrobiia bacterium]|nr:Stp1/IreP family PP2C-type Ser/Thr phosphatase [Acidimicrobiia bacterium]
MKYIWASGSHVGRVRSGNEDSVFPRRSGSTDGSLLVAVADGMGGHVAGEVASRVAIDAATEASEAEAADRVTAANEAVSDKAAADPQLHGMGTTMSLADLSAGGHVRIGHVGDSRIYLLRDGALSQVTTDHTFVAALLESGQITADEVDTHPKRHYVTRALGLDRSVEVDEQTLQLEPGDRLMLCSDGLTEMVSDTDISEVLSRADAPEPAVWSLIEMANKAGGVDNISVIVVDYLE